MKFTQKIAKHVAQKQFDRTLDSLLGLTDPDLNLTQNGTTFHANFSEDLKEMNIEPTNLILRLIGQYYDTLVAKAYSALSKMYSK